MWKHEKGLEISNDLAASNMLSDSMWQMLKKKAILSFFSLCGTGNTDVWEQQVVLVEGKSLIWCLGK